MIPKRSMINDDGGGPVRTAAVGGTRDMDVIEQHELESYLKLSRQSRDCERARAAARNVIYARLKAGATVAPGDFKASIQPISRVPSWQILEDVFGPHVRPWLESVAPNVTEMLMVSSADRPTASRRPRKTQPFADALDILPRDG